MEDREKMKILLTIMSLVAASWSQVSATPVKTEALQDLGLFRPSFYWIALEKQDSLPKNVSLLDIDGNVLARVSDSYHTELRMEGTGLLTSGKLINFKARLTKPDGSTEIRWRWCGPEAPYGYGFEDIPLIPFRSAAVDPTVIPIGSKLYIPAAKGAALPDGTVHDGYFHAIDIGSAITDRKIDIFTSFGNQAKYFERIGFSHGKMSRVYLVK